MVKKTLGREMDKGQQRSNWDRAELTPKQILYAADDSVCALQIIAALMRKHGKNTVLEKIHENMDKARIRDLKKEKSQEQPVNDDSPVKTRIKEKCE